MAPEQSQPDHDSAPESAPSSDRSGSLTFRLGGYDLIQRIGDGGMGTVWKARQLSLDRIVALKVLNASYSKNQEFLNRFRNEARAAASLIHGHIIQVYDAGRADGVDYLTMEFVEGKTVRAVLDAKGFMREQTALDIVLPVTQALAFAWDRARIIHRDVKPENIMIDRDGIVKLGDLGLAKQADTPDSARLTRAGQTLGTPHYIAPEQAEACRDLDFRADIYSLGATLYHMVTGHALFEDSPTATAMLQHIDGHVQDARHFQPQLSEGLCMILERMLAKNRAERYQSWQDLISDLQLVRAGRRPVNARMSTGHSTMLRHDGPPPTEPSHKQLQIQAPFQMTPLTWAGLAVIAVCVAGMILLWELNSIREGQLRAEHAERLRNEEAAAATRAYYETVDYSRTHSNDVATIISRFDAVATRFPNTEFAPNAKEQSKLWRSRLAAKTSTAKRGPVSTNVLKSVAIKQPSAATNRTISIEDAASARAELERGAIRLAAQKREAAQVAYRKLLPDWLTRLAKRDYAGASKIAEEWLASPDLAVWKPLMQTHILATDRISRFVKRLTAPDSPLIGTKVQLANISGTVTSFNERGAVTIEKVPGVGVVMPGLTASSDDFLRLAAASVKPGDGEGQLNYALLLIAEYRLELARVALYAAPDVTAAPFEEMYAAVCEHLNEIEAPAYLESLRKNVAAELWPPAFACLIVIDSKMAKTAAVLAAERELAVLREQLLALPPETQFAESAVRLLLVNARNALEASKWRQAIATLEQIDKRLADSSAPVLSAAVRNELTALRARVAESRNEESITTPQSTPPSP